MVPFLFCSVCHTYLPKRVTRGKIWFAHFSATRHKAFPSPQRVKKTLDLDLPDLELKLVWRTTTTVMAALTWFNWKTAAEVGQDEDGVEVVVAAAAAVHVVIVVFSFTSSLTHSSFPLTSSSDRLEWRRRRRRRKRSANFCRVSCAAFSYTCSPSSSFEAFPREIPPTLLHYFLRLRGRDL